MIEKLTYPSEYLKADKKFRKSLNQIEAQYPEYFNEHNRPCDLLIHNYCPLEIEYFICYNDGEFNLVIPSNANIPIDIQKKIELNYQNAINLNSENNSKSLLMIYSRLLMKI